MNFIVIPVYEDMDADLIRLKEGLVSKFEDPEEPGKGVYFAGRCMADLIRKGLIYEADNRAEKGGFDA